MILYAPKYLKAAIACLLATTSIAASAQSKSSGDGAEAGLTDIVVTATRRATNVQDVPIAITAIGGTNLRDRGISDPQQLSSLAPSLNVDQGQGNSNTHISLRGLASTELGIGPSSPIAIYVDDIYQPFQYGLATQIYDLNRIEVLRGPQGTLFGKNTTGGALNYYSQTPLDRKEGYVNLEGGGGDYTHFAAEGAYNTPLTENLAMRFSFRAENRGDSYDVLNPDSPEGKSMGHFGSLNARLQFAWKPSSETNVNLRLFAMRSRGDIAPYVGNFPGNPCTSFFASFFCDAGGALLGAAPSNPRQTYSFGDTYERSFGYGGSLKVDQSVGEFMLTSVTGLQRGGYGAMDNGGGLAGDFFHARYRSRSWQVSQEFRLATPVAKPLRAVFGLFGMHDKIDISQGFGSTYSLFQYAGVNAVRQGTTSLAAFTSVTYDITKQISVVGGARISYDRKKIDTPFVCLNSALCANGIGDDPTRILTDSDLFYKNALAAFDPAVDYFEDNAATKSWKRFTWDITANFKPNDDVLLYAKYSTGYRAGGYPMGITVPGTFNIVQPESVKAYEVGAKSEFLDRKLRVNLAAYQTDYTDMQVNTTNGTGAGLRFGNAGSARIRGVEAEIEALPVRNLHLSSSVGYIDAKYRDFASLRNGLPTNFAGNVMPYAPRWTANISADYDIIVGTGKFTLGADWNYRDKIYFDPFQDPFTSDGAAWRGNLRVAYTSGSHWSLTAYVDNVTNKAVKNYAYAVYDPFNPLSNTAVFTGSNYAPLRTFGFRLGYKY